MLKYTTLHFIQTFIFAQAQTIINKMQQIGAALSTETDIDRLILKIRRLKNRLISYGISTQELIQIILYDFLKAPRIDWTVPHNTVKFYQAKQKYCVDNSITQLILTLSESVPNWQSQTVLTYLHETITYNSLSFGIDLQNSDDSSNQDGADMTLLLIKAKKKNKQFNLRPKKRGHHSNYSNSLNASSANVVHYSKKKEQYDQYDPQCKKKVHLNFNRQKKDNSEFQFHSISLKKQNSYSEDSSSKMSRNHNVDEYEKGDKFIHNRNSHHQFPQNVNFQTKQKQDQRPSSHKYQNEDDKSSQRDTTNFILLELDMKRLKPECDILQEQKVQKKVKK